MKRKIDNCFCGVLDLLETRNDSHFSVNGNIVTILPLTEEARQKVHELSYNDGSNEKEHWIYGYTEDNCAIAILQTTHLRGGFSSRVDLSAAKFCSPLIVKGANLSIADVKSFNVIEFYGGIMDKLHSPDQAIEERDGFIKYNDPENYTSEYEVVLDKIRFRVVYTIKVPNYKKAGEVPDLKNEIHSVLRLEFETPQSLETIQTYYGYAMNLFQFCSGRLNVHAEVRLYKNGYTNPIFVKLIDGFLDYADDIINFTHIIRLNFLGEKFPDLFQLLNTEKDKKNDKGNGCKRDQPYLLFLPSKNGNVGKVLYTDVNDLCIAFEREYSKWEDKASMEKREAAGKLTEELMKVIDSAEDCPDDVKTKARNILNTQLKAFSPSLKEKILWFYKRYGKELRTLTEIEDHVKLGIAKAYSDKEFQKMITKFIEIRNKAAHAGIKWNGGEEIFVHLKILVYYSVLERTGFLVDEISCLLSWLFGWQF